MTYDAASVFALLREVIKSPKDNAVRVLSVPLRLDVLWQVLFLIIAISASLSYVTTALTGPMTDQFGNEMTSAGPFALALLSLASAVLTIYAVFWGGRAVGGTGSFHDVLQLFVWLQVIGLGLQVVLSLIALILPALVGLGTMAMAGISIWLLVNFTAVVHGFTSLGKVFLGILFLTLVIATGLVFLMTLVGFSVTGGM